VEGVEGGDPCIVKVAGGVQLSASCVVVCTNASISDYVQTHAKMEPNRTYAIAAAIPRGSVEKALYWDTGQPYHYVRLQRLEERQRPSSEPTAEQQRPSSEPTAGSRQPISKSQGQAVSATPDKGQIHWDALIVGGEDRKTGHDSSPEERWDALERWMRERWPEAREVMYRWSGQVLEPSDGLAYIGRNPDGAENVFMASGDSGQGMTHGTIAGILLADIIAGRANPWETLYDPKRVSLGASSLKEMAKHNVDVAAQYAKGVLKPDVKSLDDIAPGEGAIVRRGTKKIAVYKTPEGRVVEKSALCTHLKCVVRWNGMEKSWDCPCHGSRFTPTGEVLNGPAIMALEDVEPEAASQPSSRRTARKAKA
jgi:Rieske Fe-S protein